MRIVLRTGAYCLGLSLLGACQVLVTQGNGGSTVEVRSPSSESSTDPTKKLALTPRSDSRPADPAGQLFVAVDVNYRCDTNSVTTPNLYGVYASLRYADDGQVIFNVGCSDAPERLNETEIARIKKAADGLSAEYRGRRFLKMERVGDADRDLIGKRFAVRWAGFRCTTVFGETVDSEVDQILFSTSSGPYGDAISLSRFGNACNDALEHDLAQDKPVYRPVAREHGVIYYLGNVFRPELSDFAR